MGAVDRRADHRNLLVDRDHRRAGLNRARHARPLTCPLDEQPERMAVTHDLAHRPHGLAIGLAPPDRECSEGAHELTEAGNPVGLDLRHEVERPWDRRSEYRRVDPAEVVRRDHEPALERDALGSVHPHRRHELHGRADRGAPDRPDRVRPVHRTASTSRDDSLHDLVDRELGRVEQDRVVGRHRVDGIPLVAVAEIGGERLGLDAGPVGGASARPLVLVGLEEDLHVGSGSDDLPDVAPLDHRVASERQRPLALAHDRAYLRVTRHRRHEAVDLGLSDRGRDVLAVELHRSVLAERDGTFARELRQCCAVRHVDTVAQRDPGQCAVHRPGVEVPEAEPPRECRGNRALPGAGRPVDGDDHVAGG